MTLGDWYQEDWIVTQGLRGGETVAVDGAIKRRPGAPVKVVEAGPATGPAEKSRALRERRQRRRACERAPH